MSEAGYVTTGETPVTRSLAAVLRDAFSGPDDAARIINATGVQSSVAAAAGRVRVNINGSLLDLPALACSIIAANANNPIIEGRPILVLATRTQLVVLDIFHTTET
jgi:hypothetical protein